FTLIVVSIAVFAVTEIAPGNIAVNTLGNTITPAQEASFNAQHGLGESARTRYIRWLFGSDWQAEELVGHPITRIFDEQSGQYSWWAVAEDGSLFQNSTVDGEQIIRSVRQPDGTLVAEPVPGNPWTVNDEGVEVFWGVDDDGHAAMWVRGDDLETWKLTAATWTSAA
ncbi:MAG: hypothetical protein KC423_30140, partial [Anaerolineales bacterium]|nr:hypothetical protein [Anaerolineales bacterium]